MYPYRRSNQRKRTRPNPRRNKASSRRLPSSARELLPLMQPATKALAQVLAGNTKSSGQFVHARNVVERADQMIAEKQLDRLTLRDREEFLEQLARLKLTVNDAEEEFGPLEPEGDEDGGEGEGDGDEAPDGAADVQEQDPAELEAERERAEVEAAEQRERLKRVALALMSPSTEAPPPRRPTGPSTEDYQPPAESASRAVRPRRESTASKTGTKTAGAARRPRITLRSSEREAAADAPAEGDEHGVASDG